MKTNYFFCLLALVLSLYSCGSDDEQVAPVTPTVAPLNSPAKFQQNRKIIERGESVEFRLVPSNVKITRYEWDFGNGQTATTRNGYPQYHHLGTYTVKLTVYDTLNTPYTATSTVKVGRKYLTAVTFQQIAFTNSSGQPWDRFGDGPDLLLQIGPDFNQFDHTYPVYPNFTADKLPYTFQIPDTISIGSVKHFSLDDDDTDHIPNLLEPMYSFWTATLEAPVKDYETGKGTILGDYSMFNYKFLLHFEVR